jgi:para-nitrobenzyl esterase
MRAAWVWAIAGLVLGLSWTAQADSLTVKTEQGRVHGKTINGGKVKAFLGLPYAAAPIRDLRWKSPQPPAAWKGERDATRFGAHCAQITLYPDIVFEDSASSEDCLFLNVYAPAEPAARAKSNGLPVMFWIHGGSYAVGASSEPRHNGDFLPLKGVVLVTINYRLGVFGFLATKEMAKEADGAAGNYGLQDMAAALRWVKANIRQFGGDPDNVTIFGESAGSFAVSTLMASPAARGLFHKAIGESGAAFDAPATTGSLEAEEKKHGEWMASLGVKTLAELRALPTEKILEASNVKLFNCFSPYVDGKLLTEPVEASYAAGRQAHVPLLAGWNRDEASFRASGWTAEKWKAEAVKLFAGRSAEFLRLYPGENDEQATRSATDYYSDAFIVFRTWKWVEAHRKTGGPVYRYHFELPALPSNFHPGVFAFHADEIEYVFGTLDTRPGATVRPEDRKLSEQMMSYWTNFAKTGDPNGPGLRSARSPWPQYGENDSLIHLDSKITSGPDTLRARYEFLSKGMPEFVF